jgi:hypothetical protein
MGRYFSGVVTRKRHDVQTMKCCYFFKFCLLGGRIGRDCYECLWVYAPACPTAPGFGCCHSLKFHPAVVVVLSGNPAYIRSSGLQDETPECGDLYNGLCLLLLWSILILCQLRTWRAPTKLHRGGRRNCCFRELWLRSPTSRGSPPLHL